MSPFEWNVEIDSLSCVQLEVGLYGQIATAFIPVLFFFLMPPRYNFPLYLKGSQPVALLPVHIL